MGLKLVAAILALNLGLLPPGHVIGFLTGSQTRSCHSCAQSWSSSTRSCYRISPTCCLKLVAAILALNLGLLPPGHVIGFLQHVVSLETRDGHNWGSGRIVSNLLDVGIDFLANFLEPFLGEFRLSAVHLVDSNHHLLHTQSKAQQNMLTSLAILRDTSLKLSSTSSNNQHSTISLGSS